VVRVPGVVQVAAEHAERRPGVDLSRQLRQLGGLREACLFHLEVIERLEGELQEAREQTAR
jgi:hypothetical protein